MPLLQGNVHQRSREPRLPSAIAGFLVFGQQPFGAHFADGSIGGRIAIEGDRVPTIDPGT
jgi:hypothetical protein